MNCERVPTPPLDAAAALVAVPLSVGTPSTLTASTPATVWSDGDRERLPTQALIAGSATVLAARAAEGDRALGRQPKDVTGTLHNVFALLVDKGLLTAHVMVCALSIVSRASDAMPKTFNSLTAKRVVVSAAILAAKAEADEQISIAYYAETTGISAETIRGTECQLFERLDFNLATNAARFQDALAQVTLECPAAEWN